MADLNITITIPENYIPRVQEAFNSLAATEIELKNEFARIFFEIPEKQTGESNLQFGRRFIRKAMKQFVRLHELDEDGDRYKSEVSAVSPPEESVPDDIIT